MPLYCVTYDLKGEPSSAYSDLIASLTTYSDAVHAQQSVWLICTPWTAREIYDHFMRYLHPGDSLLVLQLGPNSAHCVTANTPGIEWLAAHPWDGVSANIGIPPIL